MTVGWFITIRCLISGLPELKGFKRRPLTKFFFFIFEPNALDELKFLAAGTLYFSYLSTAESSLMS
jgi:hypothetical protein